MNTGKIRGIVVESPVALDHHQRDFVAFQKDALGAFVHLDHAFIGTFLNAIFDDGVVEAFALLLELDVQARIDFLEVRAGNFANHVPGFSGGFVARLQLDHGFLGFFLEFGVGVESK